MENLKDLFQGLTEQKKEYFFKKKYEFALYLEINIKNPPNKEILFQFKLALTKYLSNFDQLKGAKKPHHYLQTYK